MKYPFSNLFVVSGQCESEGYPISKWIFTERTVLYFINEISLSFLDLTGDEFKFSIVLFLQISYLVSV